MTFPARTLLRSVSAGQAPTLPPPCLSLKVEIFAESETGFFLKVVDAQITFVRDSTGAVTGLVLHQNGRDTPGRRLP